MLLFLLHASFVGMMGCSPAGTPLLFTDTLEIPQPPPFEEEAWLLDARGVVVHPSLLDPGELSVGDSLRFVTMGDREVDFVVDRLDGHNALQNLRARTVVPEQGEVLLTIGQNRAHGLIQLYEPLERYYLRYYEAADLHVLMLVDPSEEDVLPGAEAEAP